MGGGVLMETSFTRSVIVVVRPAVVAAMNVGLKNAAFDPVGGDKTFTVPLRAAGDAANTIVGYWAAGAATPTMLNGLASQMTTKGATAAETTLIPKGTKVGTVAAQRVFCFDASVWAPVDVLAFLGLDVLASNLGAA
jgi:hypothetical protein